MIALQAHIGSTAITHFKSGLVNFCLTLFQDKVRKKNALRQIETPCHCSTQTSSNVYYTLPLFRLRKSNEEKYGIKTKRNVNIPATNIENN